MSTYLNTQRGKRKLFVFLIAAIFLSTLAWYINGYGSFEALAVQETRLRNLIAVKPWRSFFAGFGIYVALALVPGTGGKAIV